MASVSEIGEACGRRAEERLRAERVSGPPPLVVRTMHPRDLLREMFELERLTERDIE